MLLHTQGRQTVLLEQLKMTLQAAQGEAALPQVLLQVLGHCCLLILASRNIESFHYQQGSTIEVKLAL